MYPAPDLYIRPLISIYSAGFIYPPPNLYIQRRIYISDSSLYIHHWIYISDSRFIYPSLDLYIRLTPQLCIVLDLYIYIYKSITKLLYRTLQLNLSDFDTNSAPYVYISAGTCYLNL